MARRDRRESNAGEGVERGSKGAGKPNKALTVFAHGGGEGLQAMPTARTIQFGSDLCPYGVGHGHGKGDPTSRPGPERSTVHICAIGSPSLCAAHTLGGVNLPYAPRQHYLMYIHGR